MQSNTAAQFLPAISDDKKLEVSIETNEVVLKLRPGRKALVGRARKRCVSKKDD
jgi:hypothetical protein